MKTGEEWERLYVQGNGSMQELFRAAQRDALETAAKVCGDAAARWGGKTPDDDPDDCAAIARLLGQRIRELKP